MKAPFRLPISVRPTGDWLGGPGGAILCVISRRERTGATERCGRAGAAYGMFRRTSPSGYLTPPSHSLIWDTPGA